MVTRARLRSGGTSIVAASPAPSAPKPRSRPAKRPMTPQPSPSPARSTRSRSASSSQVIAPITVLGTVLETNEFDEDDDSVDSVESAEISTQPQTLVISSRVDAVRVLLQAASKQPIPELLAFKEFFCSNEFFNGLDDYTDCWDYTNFLSWLVTYKLAEANKNINKARLHKNPVKVSDTMNFNAETHVVSVCVPCFEAGRLPQRCLFTGLSGFVNHRKVGISDPCATAFDMCKNPITSKNVINVINVNGGPNTQKERHYRTEGYNESHYRLFRLPFLLDDYSSVDFQAVQTDGAIPGIKWEEVPGSGCLEHNMSFTSLQQFVREVIAGQHPEYMITDKEKPTKTILSTID